MVIDLLVRARSQGAHRYSYQAKMFCTKLESVPFVRTVADSRQLFQTREYGGFIHSHRNLLSNSFVLSPAQDTDDVEVSHK